MPIKFMGQVVGKWEFGSSYQENYKLGTSGIERDDHVGKISVVLLTVKAVKLHRCLRFLCIPQFYWLPWDVFEFVVLN